MSKTVYLYQVLQKALHDKLWKYISFLICVCCPKLGTFFFCGYFDGVRTMIKSHSRTWGEGLWHSLCNGGLVALCPELVDLPLILTIHHEIRNSFHNSSCLLSYHQGYHGLINCKTGWCFRKLDLYIQGHRHREHWFPEHFTSKTTITEI